LGVPSGQGRTDRARAVHRRAIRDLHALDRGVQGRFGQVAGDRVLRDRSVAKAGWRGRLRLAAGSLGRAGLGPAASLGKRADGRMAPERDAVDLARARIPGRVSGQSGHLLRVRKALEVPVHGARNRGRSGRLAEVGSQSLILAAGRIRATRASRAGQAGQAPSGPGLVLVDRVPVARGLVGRDRAGRSQGEDGLSCGGRSLLRACGTRIPDTRGSLWA